LRDHLRDSLVEVEDKFPPSPDGGFIEGAETPFRPRGTTSSFHHLQMVASLRGWECGPHPKIARGFHHLQMVASLRAMPARRQKPVELLVSTISRWWLH